MLESVFVTLLQISAVAAVIVLLLKLLSSFLNKSFAAKWRYWIWLFLAVRLLIPFHVSIASPPLEVSIPNIRIPVSSPVEIQPDESPSPAPVPSENGEGLPSEPVLPKPSVQEAPAISLLQVLMFVWLAGALVFAAWQGTRYVLFRKKSLRWGKAPSENTAALLASVSDGMKLKKTPSVLVNSDAPSPMMTGFFRPVLLLPHESYCEEDLRFILRHELTHFKRHDIWYKLLLLAANAIHWFNPLVYLMFREASSDLELACDDEVTRGISMEERRAYSETILAAVTRRRSSRTDLSTCFHGGKKRLQQRFANILNTRRKKNGAVILLSVVLLTAVAVGAVGCSVVQPDPVSPGSSLLDPAENEDDPTVYQIQAVKFTEAGRVSERAKSFIKGVKMTAVNETVRRKELESPFQIEIALPEGWTIRRPAEGEATYAANVYAPYNIYEDGYCIGTIGYGNIFDYLLEENGDELEKEYIDIFWPMMQEERNTWDNNYLPIKQMEGAETAVCSVRYTAEMLGMETDSYNKGILSYNKAFKKCIAVELDEDSVTEEQLVSIANSVKFVLADEEKSSVSVTPANPGDKYQQVSFTFPASDLDRAEYNESIFGIEPFTASLKLPDGWTFGVVEKGEESYGGMLFSPVNLYRNSECVGTIGYNTFEIYPEAGDNYVAVYSGLMMGSVVSWDVDYAEVKKDDVACTATCKVMHRVALPGQVNVNAEVFYNPAVLSYDRDLLVYIGIEFAEGAVSEAELTEIAQSIVLSR